MKAAAYSGLAISILMPSELSIALVALGASLIGYWYLGERDVIGYVLRVRVMTLLLFPIVLFLVSYVLYGTSASVLPMIGTFFAGIYLHTDAASTYAEEAGRFSLGTGEGDEYVFTERGVVDDLDMLYPWHYFGSYDVDGTVVLEPRSVYRLIHPRVELEWEGEGDEISDFLREQIGTEA